MRAMGSKSWYLRIPAIFLVWYEAMAPFIVNCLKSETTVEQIVDRMAAEYDAPRDVIASDVAKIIEKLKGIGAIDG